MLGTAVDAGNLCGVSAATYRYYVRRLNAPAHVTREHRTGAMLFDLTAVENWNRKRPGRGNWRQRRMVTPAITTTHTNHCIEMAIMAIASNNLDTETLDPDRFAEYGPVPETRDMAIEWLKTGHTECYEPEICQV